MGGRLSLVQASLLGLVSQILASLRLGMIAEIPASLLRALLNLDSMQHYLGPCSITMW